MACCIVFNTTAQHSPELVAAKEVDRQASLAALAASTAIPPSQPMGGPCSAGFTPLLFENFESGQPSGWTFSVSDGGAWAFDASDNGINGPISGSWAVVNDDADDNIGIAVATSPVLDVNGATVEVSFYYDMQAVGSGEGLYVEFWDGTNWQFVDQANAFSTTSTMFCDNDCAGNITLTADASMFGNSDFQFRLTFDDNDVWTWGFGFDNVSVCAEVICNNALQGGQFPALAVTPNPTGVTTIDNCNNEGQYSVIEGIVPSTNYQFTSTGGGGYITVTVGAVDGAVIAAGYSPVDVAVLNGDDLYVHWTADEFCTAGSTCITTTVENAGGACLADAGTLTADEASVCLFQGTATISATPSGNQVIPSGYVAQGVLTDASGTIISGGSLSHSVTAAGDYYIHYVVIDQLDAAAYQSVSSIADAYALTIDGGGSLCGSVDQTGVMITVVDCPDNDLCANAETITCGATVNGTTANAGSDGADDCHSGYEGVWYSFVGTGGDVTISTDNPGTDFDTYLAVSETCGGICVASDDDGGTGTTSLIENFTTTSGQTYYINVMQWSTAGDFELTLECAPIPCLNSSAWPTSATPLTPNATTQITDEASSADEYSEVSDVLTGHDYVFDITSGAYATVRMTTFDGPVVASGFTPLTVTATSTDNLFVHWTVDETCAVDITGTHTSTVTDLGLAPCNNDGSQWPSSAVTPSASGVTSITTCAFEGDYSVITGIEASTAYQFTSGGTGGYITVTVGAVDGPLLGAGYSPLDVATLTADDLYVHWSEDEFCNTNSTCATTTVENLGVACVVNGGTTTANATVVCLNNGTATVAVTPNGDAVVPTGYTLIGVLADGSGNLLDGGDITYDVTTAGDYYVYVAVIADADLPAYQGPSTVAGLHALTIDGGGALCGSIDQTGTLISVVDCPDNDLCADAETLVCGVPTTGSTVGATATGSPADCGAQADNLGVWYTFTGTGGDVKLSTCGTTTASSLSQPWFGVYSGPTCAQLTCVGFPIVPTDVDPDCGTAESLSYEFTTTVDETYYVFVASLDGTPNTVDFDLTLTCDPTVGITENNGIEDVTVYPNPSNGQFVVEVNGVDADAQLTVMDVAGRTVYTEGVTMNGSFRKELNLEVAKGTYLLQIITVDGMVTRKIQIN